MTDIPDELADITSIAKVGTVSVTGVQALQVLINTPASLHVLACFDPFTTLETQTV